MAALVANLFQETSSANRSPGPRPKSLLSADLTDFLTFFGTSSTRSRNYHFRCLFVVVVAAVTVIVIVV